MVALCETLGFYLRLPCWTGGKGSWLRATHAQSRHQCRSVPQNLLSCRLNPRETIHHIGLHRCLPRPILQLSRLHSSSSALLMRSAFHRCMHSHPYCSAFLNIPEHKHHVSSKATTCQLAGNERDRRRIPEGAQSDYHAFCNVREVGVVSERLASVDIRDLVYVVMMWCSVS